MELRSHLKYLRKYLWFVIVFAVICAVATYYFFTQRQSLYNVQVSYEVQLINRNATPDYAYGSYYDLKGVEMESQYIMSLLQSAAVIEDIYHTAQLGYTITDLPHFTNQFRTAEAAPQHIIVTFQRANQSDVATLTDAMTTVLAKHVEDSAKNDAGKNLFKLNVNPPVTVYAALNPWLSSLAGLAAGVLLGIVLVFLKRYLE